MLPTDGSIYGRAPGGRYVSRPRLGRMLEHEFGLLIESLADDLSGGASAGSDRIEIDMIEFNGPAFAACESRLLNLHLIRSWLTRAVMFDPDGHVVQPGEALRRKDVLAVRSNFRPVTRRHEDMIRAGVAAFAAQAGSDKVGQKVHRATPALGRTKNYRRLTVPAAKAETCAPLLHTPT